MAKKDLAQAKSAKKDEFYTRLSDIEKELQHYKPYFEGKVVLCNCDDPYESNFFQYFANNFNEFRLKKLIATGFETSFIAGTDMELDFDWGAEYQSVSIPIRSGKAHKIELTEVRDMNGDGAVNMFDVRKYIEVHKDVLVPLQGSGDFQSDECLALLCEADIVVTNPPFSLFREFIETLIEYDKQFIILGNTNALTYKEVFKLFQENKIRTGYTNFNVGMFFVVPDHYSKYHHIEDGKKIARVSTSCWFTNFPVRKHNEILPLYRHYSPERYPKYDNYDAINVDTYTDIPCDYDGAMGVPITFLDKYNPEQFEIIGAMTSTKVDEYNFGYPYVNGKKLFARILIRRRG